MSYLVHHLADRHAVILLTLESIDAGSFYPLPASLRQIRIDRLGGRGLKRAVSRRIEIFSRPTRGPGCRSRCRCQLYGHDGVTALISCIGLGIPVMFPSASTLRSIASVNPRRRFGIEAIAAGTNYCCAKPIALRAIFRHAAAEAPNRRESDTDFCLVCQPRSPNATAPCVLSPWTARSAKRFR